jgi:hypothetical protein
MLRSSIARVNQTAEQGIASRPVLQRVPLMWKIKRQFGKCAGTIAALDSKRSPRPAKSAAAAGTHATHKTLFVRRCAVYRQMATVFEKGDIRTVTDFSVDRSSSRTHAHRRCGYNLLAEARCRRSEVERRTFSLVAAFEEVTVTSYQHNRRHVIDLLSSCL